MYTIIFTAALLLADYLQRTGKTLAGRIVFGCVVVAGFMVSSLSIQDNRWWSAFTSLITAVIIVALVELYIKLGRFEVKK
jgi:uncharacterized membrane protein